MMSKGLIAPYLYIKMDRSSEAAMKMHVLSSRSQNWAVGKGKEESEVLTTTPGAEQAMVHAAERIPPVCSLFHYWSWSSVFESPLKSAIDQQFLLTINPFYLITVSKPPL